MSPSPARHPVRSIERRVLTHRHVDITALWASGRVAGRGRRFTRRVGWRCSVCGHLALVIAERRRKGRDRVTRMPFAHIRHRPTTTAGTSKWSRGWATSSLGPRRSHDLGDRGHRLDVPEAGRQDDDPARHGTGATPGRSGADRATHSSPTWPSCTLDGPPGGRPRVRCHFRWSAGTTSVGTGEVDTPRCGVGTVARRAPTACGSRPTGGMSVALQGAVLDRPADALDAETS